MLLNLSVPFASTLASALLAIATAPAAPELAAPTRSHQCQCDPTVTWDNFCQCDPIFAIFSSSTPCNDPPACDPIAGNECKASVTITWGEDVPPCASNTKVNLRTGCTTFTTKQRACASTCPCTPGHIDITLSCSSCNVITH